MTVTSKEIAWFAIALLIGTYVSIAFPIPWP